MPFNLSYLKWQANVVSRICNFFFFLSLINSNTRLWYSDEKCCECTLWWKRLESISILLLRSLGSLSPSVNEVTGPYETQRSRYSVKLCSTRFPLDLDGHFLKRRFPGAGHNLMRHTGNVQLRMFLFLFFFFLLFSSARHVSPFTFYIVCARNTSMADFHGSNNNGKKKTTNNSRHTHLKDLARAPLYISERLRDAWKKS